MKILMVSAEVFPFAKTGGLADAVEALSKSLSSLGNDVKIIMPRYYKIDRNSLTLIKKSVPVNLGFGEAFVDFYEKDLGGTKVYFVDYEKCFGREGIYGNEWESDFHDNPFRFAVLSRSAFALCSALNWLPDVIHSHDWSTALVPVLLKYCYRGENSPFKNTKSVLTIHNMGYQGHYHSSAYGVLGLSGDLFHTSGFDDGYGGINFLKAGITSADFITTVSKTYAEEIKTASGGFGLDGLVRVRSSCLFGIVNGADTDDWNPKKDKALPKNYSATDLSGKAVCKKRLQSEFGLKQDEKVPIIGMIGRLVEQKGIAEVFAPMYGSLYKMCSELNVQFVVLGSGEKWCENEIMTLSGKLENLASFIGYSEAKSRLIEAGTDFFLMPSKYEPCGLNQIYSMLYGTLPIVHYTGGLADTVKNYDEKTGAGTGFTFYDLTPDAIFGTVKYAVETYYNRPDHYKKMQQEAMTQNFSWKTAAKEYMKVYER